ncbi:hypothetical protein BOX15_Mlig017369g1, partial [Macrostomum lignano]
KRSQMSQTSSSTTAKVTIDLVLKVGGSCLTDKSGREQLRQDGLDRLAELATAIEAVKVDDDVDDGNAGYVQRRRRLRWVLLHGAGSFGHPHATDARLTDGIDARQLAKLSPVELQQRRLGFCDTRRAVQDLAGRVAACLVKAGIPVTVLSPCSHFSDVTDFVGSHCPPGLVDRISDLLQAGFVPALHGDAVLALDRDATDETIIGWSVLGGDALAAKLAESFDLRRAVFVTSSGGVFSQDPATAPPGMAHLLPEIRLGGGSSQDVAGVGGAAPGVSDVTGGMRGKLAAAVRLLKASPNTVVRVCGWESALAACLDTCGGDGSCGTRVLSE